MPVKDKLMETKANIQDWIRKNRILWGLILVAFFALLRFLQTVAWRGWFGSADFQESISFALFLVFWFVVISLGLVVGGIVRLTGATWTTLGWKRDGWLKSVGMGLLGFVLLYLNIIVWAILGGNSEAPRMITPSLTRVLIVAFFAFGLPAWAEENLFRGYLQPLLAARLNLGLAVLIQAIIFSAAHIGYSSSWIDFGSAFTTGLILGWLRGRESNLLAPFLAHGLFWMLGAFMLVTG